MLIHKRQELMRIYDEKLNTSDPPYGFEARFAYVTADWINSLDKPDRANVFEYIGSILQQPGERAQKLRTVMMLAMLSCPDTEALMDKMLEEGSLIHPPIIMQFVCSNKALCEKKEEKTDLNIELKIFRPKQNNKPEQGA